MRDLVKICFYCTFLFLLASEAAAASRYYLVPQDWLSWASIEKRAQIDTQGSFRLVRLSLPQALSLSKKVHQHLGSCGGFFDVTDEVKVRGPHLAPNVVKMPLGPISLRRFKARKIRAKGLGRQAISVVSKERYIQLMKKIVSFPNRAATTEEGRQAFQWLKRTVEHWRDLSKRDDLQILTVKTGKDFLQDSLVVRLVGRAGEKRPGVVLGAHMDTYPGNGMQGADDDASGMATVLEVLQAILRHNMTFDRDIYFALYAAEELGLLGSKKVAALFRQKKIRLEAVLQFDMTAYKAPQETRDMYLTLSHSDRNLNRYLKLLATTILGLPLSQIGTRTCLSACSDHASWYRRGYATAFPFEAKTRHSAVKRFIHTRHDTLDKLDFDHAMNFVRLAMAFVSEVAHLQLSWTPSEGPKG